MRRKLSRVLVVEDNSGQRRAIARALAGRGIKVLEAAGAREAIALLQPVPDALILDVHLSEGSVFDILDAARALWPAPIKIAMSGVSSSDETFRLASSGVRAFLKKPFSLEELEATLDSVCEHGPDLTAALQDSVGHVSVRRMVGLVRDIMLRQALALSKGSRAEAARLLQVTRQAVQQMIRPEVRRSSKRQEDPLQSSEVDRSNHL